jgi:hypothetical protein
VVPPGRTSGGQVAAQFPVHALVVPVSLSNVYSVLPVAGSTMMVPKVALAVVATVALGAAVVATGAAVVATGSVVADWPLLAVLTGLSSLPQAAMDTASAAPAASNSIPRRAVDPCLAVVPAELCSLFRIPVIRSSP